MRRPADKLVVMNRGDILKLIVAWACSHAAFHLWGLTGALAVAFTIIGLVWGRSVLRRVIEADPGWDQRSD